MEQGSKPAAPKTDRAYWDQLWSGVPMPEPVHPRRGGLRNYAIRRLHASFAKIFSGVETQGKTLLEIGCARSAWLPYFHREFGFRVSGIDYSEIGCAQEMEILARARVKGEIVHCDLFHPPQDLIETFDVAVSIGLVEHFDDTAECIGACARFLRPDGLMITLIPNMRGLPGWLQRRVNSAVYDAHVPLDRGALERAHEEAGLRVRSCNYLLGTNWWVLNTEGVRPWLRKQVFGGLISVASRGSWLVEGIGLGPPPNRFTSPYIICVAKRPSERNVWKQGTK